MISQYIFGSIHIVLLHYEYVLPNSRVYHDLFMTENILFSTCTLMSSILDDCSFKHYRT
jgi:hypothetical protein